MIIPRERTETKAACEDCTLKDRQFVPTYVPEDFGLSTDHPVLWVGQAPGEDEVLVGQPFKGAAGKQHYSCLREAGFNQSRMPHANVCGCWPPRDQKGNDREPSDFEQRCCFERLKEEIHLIRPSLIVALGGIPMFALTGAKGSVLQQRGRFLDLLGSYEFPCKVLVSPHPSFVRRSRQWIPTQVETYKLVHTYFLSGIPEVQQYDEVHDPDEYWLRDYLLGPDGRTVFAVDTESTNTETSVRKVDTLNDRILGHSFYDGATAVALKYRGSLPTHDPRWSVVSEFLESPDSRKCWQNGSFDTEIARSHGILDQGFAFDTRLAQQILQSDLPSDLDFLRATYTSIAPYKPSKREMRSIASWGTEKMLHYAALDAITTYQVMEKQKTLLTKKQMELMQQLLIPLVRAIGRIERRGFLVDVDKLASLYVQCAPTIEEYEKELYALGVNPRSPKQLIKYFNIESTNEDTLNYHIKRQHPKADVMQKILYYREVYNLASKYLKGIYRRLQHGRIHTHFKIEGTGTGRLSSEDPNLQNVPEVMRVIYVPDDGYDLINADYKQIELWAGAAMVYIITGDDSMLRDLQQGLDIHYISCQLCFPHVPCTTGVRKKDFDHRQNLIAKTVTFGTFYGRGAGSIAREFGCTRSEAESWQLKIVNKYPGLNGYREYCTKMFRSQGFLETPFGRVRHLQSLTQGFNFPVQSTASDITLGSIVGLDREGVEILATVHDSIVLQVKRDELTEGLDKVKRVMERPVPELLNLTFKVDYTHGRNWYEQETL